MKKLLLALFAVVFVGTSFAYSPTAEDEALVDKFTVLFEQVIDSGRKSLGDCVMFLDIVAGNTTNQKYKYVLSEVSKNLDEKEEIVEEPDWDELLDIANGDNNEEQDEGENVMLNDPSLWKGRGVDYDFSVTYDYDAWENREIPEYYATMYQIKDGSVYWYGNTELEDVDLDSFEIIWPSDITDTIMAKDKNHVYCNQEIWEGVDPNDLQIIKGVFISIGNDLYKRCEKIKGSDANTLTLGSDGYARDANQSYYLEKSPVIISKPLDMAPNESEYEIIGAFEGRNPRYFLARDSERVYSSKGYPLSFADANTFEIVHANYWRDHDTVWWFGQPLRWADPETFQSVGGYDHWFAKDENYVYCKSIRAYKFGEYRNDLVIEGEGTLLDYVLPNVDPDTFYYDSENKVYGDKNSSDIKCKM